MYKFGRAKKGNSFWLAFPSVFWLSLFFLIPLLFVFVASFMSRGQGGAPDLPFSLEAYGRTINVYGSVIWRTVVYAFYTTVLCLLVGFPVAFYISRRKSNGFRQILLFLVLLPFWTNFLVRTYALQSMMGREGLINTFLQNLGLITEPLAMLNTPFAVLVGQVYGFLPFMILPIYAAVERLDFKYVEAANDLGANDWHSFWKVIFPLTLPGVVAGCMLVFIPSIGSFVTPDLLGGTGGLMIGNLIQQRFRGTGASIPLGSAVSMVMMVIVFAGVLIYTRFGEREN
jgi:spermidine/putrescine transport system permease protein